MSAVMLAAIVFGVCALVTALCARYERRHPMKYDDDWYEEEWR